jgi:tol-pal system protein YbgF
MMRVPEAKAARGRNLSGSGRDGKSTLVRALFHARIVLAGLISLAVAGCATQADIQDLALEQRKIRGQLADTRASLETVQRELAQLRGGVDEARYSSRDRRTMEMRLAELEARVATSPLPVSTPAPYGTLPDGATPLSVATPAAAVSSSCLGSDPAAPEPYQQGVTLLREGSYDRAIKAFREFLRTSRDSPQRASGHYGIGESYFMLGDYYQAILNFNDVRQEYGRSACAPAAVLKIGLAFLQMGNKSEARVAFQKVVNDYPSAPEAAQAREKLRTLGA